MLSFCFILLLLISILTPSYGQVTCASGWVQYGGSCYLFRPVLNPDAVDYWGQPGTWDQCNAYCPLSYPGASMLCVNDEGENTWLNSQFGGYTYFIGYTDMPPYGGGKGTKQYGWVTGCSSTYTNWEVGSPDNNNNNEDYVGSYKNHWQDTYPSKQWFCGCEYTPALTTSDPTVAPSSGRTFSPTATPSFRPSAGGVSE
jgi:hypothetical protein